ncbi:MAG: DUF4399 domain-containing protein [Pseudomonadota bacterium]
MKRILFAALVAMTGPAFAQGTPAPEGAEVYFIGLEDGATVESPVTLRFGLTAGGIAPAGVEQANTGHHHIFLNRPPLGEGEFGAEELSIPLPADENHIHFGGGQTQATLDLPAGTHTLQLVLGDHNHIPHDPPIASDVITITVE